MPIVIGALGIIFVVIGFKGNGDNLIAAITGKKYRNSTLQ